MKTTVYRSGVVEAPTNRGAELAAYATADSVRPADRQGRNDCIFASPNLNGVARWAYSNSSIMSLADPFVREITVDSDSVFVYSVNAWESCSVHDNNFEKYWATGVTLTEWLTNSESYDPSEWELLLNVADVITVKNVSDRRLLKAVEASFTFAANLATALKSARRAAKFA